MNKLKFLGSAVMAAFMAFNLASCEKESFTTETDVTVTPPTITIPGINLEDIPQYQPGNAVVAIQPTVNALINGIVTDVTSKATIKIAGKEQKYFVLTEKTITEQSVLIEVSYTVVIEGLETTLSETKEIRIPALSEGMVTIITPTIWVSANTKGYFTEVNNIVNGNPISKEISVKNQSIYWYSNQTAEIKFVEKGAYLVGDVRYNEDYKNDEEVKAWVNNIVKAYSTELKPATMTYTYPVYAMSQTIINYSQTLVTTDYQIIKTIQLSRANDSKEIVVAEFTIDEYGDFNAEIKTNIHLNGISHGHGHGHGNGHGHGDYNAGGSIVDAL